MQNIKKKEKQTKIFFIFNFFLRYIYSFLNLFVRKLFVDFSHRLPFYRILLDLKFLI